MRSFLAPRRDVRCAAPQVDRDLKEIHRIRESLGDDEADSELSQCQV